MPVVMNILKIVLLIIVVFISLLVLALFVLRPLMSFLAKPSDIKKAAIEGKKLANQQESTVLAITAHPDDAEWYAGGTLALLAKKNDVILLLGTSGEKGARGDNVGELREKKQEKASKIIGYKKTILLRHPDRGLTNNNKYRSEIKEAINKYKPKTIITFDSVKPNYIYRHSDHMAAGEATTSVLESYDDIELYYIHSKENNVIIDFSSTREQKGKALRSLMDYGAPSGAMRFFRLLPFNRSHQFSYGLNDKFPSVNIKNGEVFRKGK